MTAKAVYIRDIHAGQSVQDVFLLADARLGQSRNGPYWNLTLQDNSGQMEAKVWSPLSQAHTDLASGQFVLLRGNAALYRDKCQLTVDQLTVLPAEEQDLAQFLATSSLKPEQLLAELEALCRFELHHKPWRSLMKKILGSDEIRARLLPATGAKAVHHAYVGGLLEHTLAVTKVCLSICNLYPQLDRQVLLCAAILHDLGKAWELTSGLSREYTDEGRLLGHIQLGLTILEPYLEKVRDLDPALVLHLKHIILSHHGEYEFGSPKRPKTSEAFVLHYADNLDAKMNSIAGALAEIDGTEQSWTPFQRYLDRYLYRPVRTPGQAQAPSVPSSKTSGSPLLLPMDDTPPQQQLDDNQPQPPLDEL